MGDLEQRLADVAYRGAAAAVREHMRNTASPTGELLVTVTEAGRRLGGVSASYVRDTLIAQGHLDVIEGVGRGTKVTVDSLNRFVAAHAVNATQPQRGLRGVA